MVCIEAAALLFTLGIAGFFFVGTLLGIAGARAQHLPPPPFDGEKLLELSAVLATCVGLTSLPTAAVLGLIASRANRRRVMKLLLAGLACLLIQDVAAAYPVAAFSPYFFSNVPPSLPFPWGADWQLPPAITLGFAWGGIVLASPLLGTLFAGAIMALERWTRPA